MTTVIAIYAAIMSLVSSGQTILTRSQQDQLNHAVQTNDVQEAQIIYDEVVL